MIVGEVNVTVEDVATHSSSYEKLIEFSDNLIPSEWRHVPAIRDNQRYLCALLLRKCSSITWDKKKPIIDRILSEVRVVGYVNELFDAKQIWSEVSVEGVMKYYERSLTTDVKPRRKVK